MVYFYFFSWFFHVYRFIEGIHGSFELLMGLSRKLYLKWENALLIRAEKVDLSALESGQSPNPETFEQITPLIRHMGVVSKVEMSKALLLLFNMTR